jgi:hypothetical protein
VDTTGMEMDVIHTLKFLAEGYGVKSECTLQRDIHRPLSLFY